MAAPGALAINPSSNLYPMQQLVASHMDMILPLWWGVFWGIFAILIARFLVYIPLKQKTYQYSDGEIIDGYVDDKTSKNIFFINEIKQDVALRLFGGAILLGFLATFAGWQMNKATTIQGIEQGLSTCWPFYQKCLGLVFLETLPNGYSQTIVYMGLFAFIFIGAYALLARRIVLAHICIFVLFAAKMYFTAINYNYNSNYDYYHTTFTLVYLFLPYKRFFGSLSVAFLYFLSTATKIHPGWLLGTYFSTLQTGLPVFPDATIPIWTGIVIFMEMVGVWFLFSSRRGLQITAAIFFATFHIYSGILVGYFYPTIVLPSVLIFFGPLFKPSPTVPVNLKSLIGWGLMVMLLCFQMISHIIPGDEKYTMEGNFYGLYMFEANHKCDVALLDDKGAIEYQATTRNARARCDVYEYWFQFAQKFCDQNEDVRYSFTVDHSINGGPFYQIVNESDFCALEYKAFAKNEWIKDPQFAQITGSGHAKNYYR